MNMTHKQGGFLFRLTGRKFWEPEQRPAPTVEEAGKLIDFCINAINNDHEARQSAVALARRFFPDFNGAEIKKRFFRKGKTPHSETGNIPEYKSGDKTDRAGRNETECTEANEDHSEPEREEEPEKQSESQKSESKPDYVPEPPKGVAADKLFDVIGAGITNVWLYGPAGCGKTTLCKQAAEALGVPCTILSCSAGTSPGEFVGFRFPSPTPTALTEAIQQPGIIVLDEMPMLDPSVAAVANALLANGEIETVCGHRVRHKHCVIIATANTTGDGGNRQYIGNNQLDAATLDRFAGGFIRVDYDNEYEASNFDKGICEYAWGLREMIHKLGLRRIVSTRAIIAADKLKKHKLQWRDSFTETWSDDDKRACGVK
jgi:hypothetical protein